MLLQLQPSGVLGSRVSFYSACYQGVKSTAFLNIFTLLYCAKIVKGFDGICQVNMVSPLRAEPSQGWWKEKFLAADHTQVTIHSSPRHNFLCLLQKPRITTEFEAFFSRLFSNIQSSTMLIPTIRNVSQNISPHFYQLFPTDKNIANTKFPWWGTK